MQEKVITPEESLTDEEQKLIEFVDEHKDELIQLLIDLVKIDSRTYDSDTYSNIYPAVEVVQKFLNKYQVPIQIIEAPHKHDKSKKWPNLIISIGEKSNGRKLGFMGHLDVVPFTEDKWKSGLNPLNPVIENNRIFGRGCLDMKSGVAAQLMALVLLKQSNFEFKGELQMICTPDEEIAGEYGARYLAQNHFDLANADARIIAEYSGLPPVKTPSIILGEKGAVWLKLTFHGAAGHGMSPKKKSNAIHKATRFIHNSARKFKIKKVAPPLTLMDFAKGLLGRFGLKNILFSPKNKKSDEEGILDSHNPLDEDKRSLKPYFHHTISFNMIRAGEKANVIPDTCVLNVDIRILPGISIQDLIDSVAKYATKLNYRIQIPPEYKNLQELNSKIQKRPIDIDVEVLTADIGRFESKTSEISTTLANTFEKVFQRKHIYAFSPGMTDASHLTAKGIKNLIHFGPSGANPHNSNEFVYIDDFLNCTKVYLLTAYQYLSK